MFSLPFFIVLELLLLRLKYVAAAPAAAAPTPAAFSAESAIGTQKPVAHTARPPL